MELGGVSDWGSKGLGIAFRVVFVLVRCLLESVKLVSSGNAVQYSTFGFMEPLSELAKISKVVLKHA